MEILSDQFNKMLDTLLPADESLLLAVSGGLDSTVLLDLAFHAGRRIAIAHINYQLRGDDSNEDAALVRKLAERYEIPLHLLTIDLKQLISEKGKTLNLQASARQQRYDYFKSVMQEFGYQKVATAHHQQDKTETFLINMMRGTGLSGLVALQAINQQIIRPLLFATKDQLHKYATDHNLTWREDSSNQKLDYLRNKIRHQVIPVLEAIQPNFQNRWIENIQQLEITNLWLNRKFEEWKIENLVYNQGTIIFHKGLIHQDNFFPLLKVATAYGFNRSQVQEIIHVVTNMPYKQRMWRTHSHQMVQERDHFELSPRIDTPSECYPIRLDKDDEFSIKDFHFVVRTEQDPSKDLNSPNTIYLNPDQWQNSLELRSRMPGDFYRPLGIEGRQKIKNFFINEKYSAKDKNQALLLAHGHEILWIVGKRKSRSLERLDLNATTITYLPK